MKVQDLHRRRFLALGVGGLTVGLSACTTTPASPPDFVTTIRRASPAIVGIGDGSSVLGSGFRLARTSWIVTAAHVVRGIRSAPVATGSGQTVTTHVLHIDDEMDLALLESDDDLRMSGLELAQGPVPPAGRWVVVLGCPFGGLPTATVGVISALPGAVLQPPALRHRIQLNAAVNPGNSGGPVVDLEGRVIGIASATVPGGFGLGFAVPVSALDSLLATLKPPS